jgi:CBS domain-containing protein
VAILVEDIMTRDIIVIDSSQTVKNAARTMVKYGISCLLVMEKGQLGGIITEQDIVSRVVASCHDPNMIIIRNIMSEPLLVVEPETPIEDAARIMLRERIKKLPVVKRSERRNSLVGLVSLMDIARLQPELLNQLKKAVENRSFIEKTQVYIS